MSADVFRLGPADVHVWTARVDVSDAEASALSEVLDDDERRRADRYLRAEDRRRFVASRGTLRRLLARYVEREPAGLRFGCAEHGKPFLRDHGDVAFNLAHSGALAAFAIARGRRVGVDIERARPVLEMEDVARRFFSPREQAEIFALDAALRDAAFLTCWVRKEAYVKARGDGLRFGLARFAVTVRPEDPARLLEVDEPGEAERWDLRALAPAPGYAGAVAAFGRGFRLDCRTWLSDAADGDAPNASPRRAGSRPGP